MLLMVDCSSDFNDSNGLNLILLSRKDNKKLMRVAPLNQYQLVDQEPHPDLQLASTKNRLLHGCTSFICFGRAATGIESPSHLKVGPTKQELQPQPQDDLQHSPESEKVSKTCTSDLNLDNLENKIEGSLKSSMKRPITKSVLASEAVNGGEFKNEYGVTEGRKVQWTDVFGGELFEIREFEPSEHGSDDESNWNEGKCTCSIM